MDQAISLLKERLAKAEAKEARAEKALESAKNDTERLRTTLEVLLDLQSESGSEPAVATTAAMVSRQSTILSLLHADAAKAQPPAEIYQSYSVIGEDISIDTFRTTIWRMKDNTFSDPHGVWIVKADNGKYWREPASMGAREAAASIPRDEGNPFLVKLNLNSNSEDDFDDHPF